MKVKTVAMHFDWVFCHHAGIGNESTGMLAYRTYPAAAGIAARMD